MTSGYHAAVEGAFPDGRARDPAAGDRAGISGQSDASLPEETDRCAVDRFGTGTETDRRGSGRDPGGGRFFADESPICDRDLYG